MNIILPKMYFIAYYKSYMVVGYVYNYVQHLRH